MGEAAETPVVILYTNWRGETALRRIIPQVTAAGGLWSWFGSTEWHPEPDWLFSALDAEKNAMRDFALSGVKAWGEAAAHAALAAMLLGRVGAAESFARRAHAGQTDKAGLPYTGHLMRVAARARAHAEALGWPPERAQLVADAAWLHDTIEDTGTTAEQLLDSGFGPEVVQAVQRLTKPKGVPYLDAIQALIATGDAVAILVKLADNEDNADPARAREDAGEAERVAKYRASAALLRAAVEGMRQAGGGDV